MPSDQRQPPVPETIMVTVTYGNRLKFLTESVRRALADERVSRVVIVSNAGTSPLEHLEQQWGTRVRIIRLPENTGSANGYAIGIRAALADGAEYLWLLDDDNAPQPGALAALRSEWKKQAATMPPHDFALLSFRPDHQPGIAAGLPLQRCYPRKGSFLGFHLLDLPYKLWCRTPWGHPKPNRLAELIPVPQAPYGGFFCHRTVIERTGTPDPALVLYADDTEFTRRLIRTGGKIFLIPASRLDDLETSWNVRKQFGSALSSWLSGNGDLRAFYGMRNQAYIETKDHEAPRMRAVNRQIYLVLLLIAAIALGRLARFRLLLDALRKGEAGRLGIDPGFPLT